MSRAPVFCFMKATILSFYGILFGITVIAQTSTELPPFPPTGEKDESVPAEPSDKEPSSKPDKPSDPVKKNIFTDPETGGTLMVISGSSPFALLIYEILENARSDTADKDENIQQLSGKNRLGRSISKAVLTPPFPETTNKPVEQLSKKKRKNNAERYYRARNGGILWVPEKGSEFYRYLEGLFPLANNEDGSRNPLSNGTDFYEIPFTTGSSNGSDGYWHYQYDLGGEGDDLVKSGSVPEGGNSWLALNMTTGQNQAYVIRFRWKVSCYEQNELRFLYNVNDEVETMSGYPDWSEFFGVLYHPQGSPMSHELKWVYEKYSHIVGGSDAVFLDGFRAAPFFWNAEPEITPFWSIDRTYVDLFWPVDVESDYQLESKSWSTLLWGVESGWNPVTSPVSLIGPYFKIRYPLDGNGMRWFRLKRID